MPSLEEFLSSDDEDDDNNNAYITKPTVINEEFFKYFDETFVNDMVTRFK